MLAGMRAPSGPGNLSLLVTASPCSPPPTYPLLSEPHVAPDSSDSALDQLRAVPKEHCSMLLAQGSSLRNCLLSHSVPREAGRWGRGEAKKNLSMQRGIRAERH